MIITTQDRESVKKVLKNLCRKKTDEEIFYDLCFCICAPQTTFKNNRKVIDTLISMNFYHCDVKPYSLLEEICKPTRFYHNKTKWLVEAKREFRDIMYQVNKWLDYRELLSTKQLRTWLVKNVKGLGYKATSHFLRNLGDQNLAIIDTHIIKFLAEEREKNWHTNYDGRIVILKNLVSQKDGYLKVEKIFQDEAIKRNLTSAELDAIIWKKYSNTDWKEFGY